MRRALNLMHFLIIMGNTPKQCLCMAWCASVIGTIAHHQHGLGYMRQTFGPVGIGIIIAPL